MGQKKSQSQLVIEDFDHHYNKEFDFYSAASQLAAQLIETQLINRGIRAIVSFRAKNPSRLHDKLLKRMTEENKSYRALEDIYEDIVDLSGVRIALYFNSELDEIDQIIRELFEIRKKKEFPLEGKSSGYKAIHYRGCLKNSVLSEQQKRYACANIEIQIASLLMHAWAEVEHGLGYKSHYEPPMDVKRKLYRLAATLEILDEEFENIRYDIALYNQSFEKIDKIMKTDINKESLIAYINSNEFLNGLVHKIADEHHYSIIKDPGFMSYQKIPTKLAMYGYQYIHELDADIQRYKKTIERIGYEMCERLYHDNVSINLYSPIMWFSFIPVIKNLISGMESTDDDMLEDIIFETFKNNNSSIFEVFNQKQ